MQNIIQPQFDNNSYPNNNINISINFNLKQKDLPPNKILNYMQINQDSKIQTKNPNSQQLSNKQIKNQLTAQSKQTNRYANKPEDIGKLKKLEMGQINKKKKKQILIKTSRNHLQMIPSAFSSTRLKNKNISKEIKEAVVNPKKHQNQISKTLASKKKSKQLDKKSQKYIQNKNKKKMSSSVELIKKSNYMIDKTPSKQSYSPSKPNSIKNIPKNISKKLDDKKIQGFDLINPTEFNEKKSLKSKIKSRGSVNWEKNMRSVEYIDTKKIIKRQNDNKIQTERTRKNKSELKIKKKQKSLNKKQSKKSSQKINRLQAKSTLVISKKSIKTDLNYQSAKKKNPIKKNNKKSSSPNTQATKIQKVWRGYIARKKILKFIKQLQVKKQYTKKNQDWHNNSNSIVKVGYQIQHSQNNNQSSYQGDWNNQEAEQCISVYEQQNNNILQILKNEVEELKIEKKLNDLKQIMRRREEQKQRILKENINLKQNLRLKQDALLRQKNQLKRRQEEISLEDKKQKQLFQIKMPIKIPNQLKQTQKSEQNQKQRKQLIQNLKKFKQESDLFLNSNKKYQNALTTQNKINSTNKISSSPTHRHQPSLLQLLTHKQKILKDKYQKSQVIINTMYANKLVSPRSYSHKMNNLQKSIQKQRIKIQKYIEQAKKINMMIGQIDKDQQNLKGLQKLSVQQKWNDALTIIDNQLLKNQIIQEKLVNQNQVFEEELLQTPKKKEQPEKGLGFETNLNFVKQYCINLCQYIRSIYQYKQIFKRNVSLPFKQNPIEFLKSYRKTIKGNYIHQYNSLKHQLLYPFFLLVNRHQKIIPKQIFIQYNNIFQKKKMSKTNPLTKQLQFYHLQCLFDVFNEALAIQRPCGVYGKPMPWIANSVYLKNINLIFQENYFDDQQQYTNQNKKFDEIFGVSIARIIQWGSTLCGFIPQSLQLSKSQIEQIDQQYINQIKETRLAFMLQKQLGETQKKMINFEIQQTEIKLHCSQIIFQCLIKQFYQQYTIDLAKRNLLYL